MSKSKPVYHFDTLGFGLMGCMHCTSIMGWKRLVTTCCACKGARQKYITLADLNVWSRPGCDCSACVIIRAMEVEIDAAIAAANAPPPEAKPEMTGPPLCGRWNTFRESFEHRRTA